MDWFKIKSIAYKDEKLLECNKLLGKNGVVLWWSLISALAEKYHGDPNESIVLNADSLAKNSFQNEKKMIENLIQMQSVFNFNLEVLEVQHNSKSTRTQTKLTFTYPKFLEIQVKYKRDGCGKFTRIKNKNKNKNKKEDGEEKHQEKCKEIMEYFNMTCSKKFILSEPRKKIIEDKLKSYSIEEIKKAILNFSKDDWDGRKKFCDIVYAIGNRKGIDNMEKWLNNESNSFNPKPRIDYGKKNETW